MSNETARAILEQRLPKLDFSNVPLELAIQFYRAESGSGTFVDDGLA